jgi:thymidylate synthase (FAD)
MTYNLMRHVKQSEELYEIAIANGICAEQARLFLPAYGMYVRYYWTASLQSVAHFLNQRLAHDSQVEIQEYAKAVFELVKDKFPVSIEELTKQA